MAIACGPKILFYGQLSNNVGSDNVSSVHHLRFAHPVYVSEVRVMGQRDLDEDARFWACKSFSAECESQPSRFKLEIYGLNLNQASQAVFQQIASIRYSGTNDGPGLSAEVSEDIPTDRLVFRGLYQKLTVAVIGVLARAASANPVDSFAELISANDSTLFDTFSHIVSLLPSPGPVVPTISLPQSRQLRPMPPPSSSAPGGFNKMARHYRPRLPNLNLLTGLSRVSAKIDVVPSGGRPESAESSCSESSGFDNSSEDDDEQVEDNSANSFELKRGDLLGLILDRAQTYRPRRDEKIDVSIDQISAAIKKASTDPLENMADLRNALSLTHKLFSKPPNTMSDALLDQGIIDWLMDLLVDDAVGSSVKSRVIHAISPIVLSARGLKQFLGKRYYDRLICLSTRRLRLLPSIDRLMKRIGFFVDLVLFNQTISSWVIESFLSLVAENDAAIVELAARHDLIGLVFAQDHQQQRWHNLKRVLSDQKCIEFARDLIAGKPWVCELIRFLKQEDDNLAKSIEYTLALIEAVDEIAEKPAKSIENLWCLCRNAPENVLGSVLCDRKVIEAISETPKTSVLSNRYQTDILIAIIENSRADKYSNLVRASESIRAFGERNAEGHSRAGYLREYVSIYDGRNSRRFASFWKAHQVVDTVGSNCVGNRKTSVLWRPILISSLRHLIFWLGVDDEAILYVHQNLESIENIVETCAKSFRTELPMNRRKTKMAGMVMYEAISLANKIIEKVVDAKLEEFKDGRVVRMYIHAFAVVENFPQKSKLKDLILEAINKITTTLTGKTMIVKHAMKLALESPRYYVCAFCIFDLLIEKSEGSCKVLDSYAGDFECLILYACASTNRKVYDSVEKFCVKFFEKWPGEDEKVAKLILDNFSETSEGYERGIVHFLDTFTRRNEQFKCVFRNVLLIPSYFEKFFEYLTSPLGVQLKLAVIHLMSSLFHRVQTPERICEYLLKLPQMEYAMAEASFACLMSIGYVSADDEALTSSIMSIEDHVDLSDVLFCQAINSLLDYVLFVIQHANDLGPIRCALKSQQFVQLTSVIRNQTDSPTKTILEQRIHSLVSIAGKDYEFPEKIEPLPLPVLTVQRVEFDFRKVFEDVCVLDSCAVDTLDESMFRTRKRRRIGSGDKDDSANEPLSVTTGSHRGYVAPMRGFGYYRGNRGCASMVSTGIRSLVTSAWNDSLRSGRIINTTNPPPER